MSMPITTAELFRLLSLSIGREKAASPYMVAKVMGVSPTTSGHWARGYVIMDERNADKAAEMLNLDREWVQLSLEAERKEKAGLSEIAAIFARAAEQASRHAASIFLGVFAVSALLSQAAATAPVCILCKTRWFLFNASRSARHRPGRPLFA